MMIDLAFDVFVLFFCRRQVPSTSSSKTTASETIMPLLLLLAYSSLRRLLLFGGLASNFIGNLVWNALAVTTRETTCVSNFSFLSSPGLCKAHTGTSYRQNHYRSEDIGICLWRCRPRQLMRRWQMQRMQFVLGWIASWLVKDSVDLGGYNLFSENLGGKGWDYRLATASRSIYRRRDELPWWYSVTPLRTNQSEYVRPF